MKKTIRVAKKSDCKFIYQMIQDLALYEKAPEKVTLTLSQLESDGFGQSPLFDSIILELDQKPVGMALFYNRYSTWKGKSLYLEDLYVLPEYRGHGLGLMTMKYLASLAIETNCRRFEWQVLDWNEPSIKFYENLGTDLDGEWINCRLEGDSIAKLASE
jgi:GNAT superfamily N-acetyltransferase